MEERVHPYEEHCRDQPQTDRDPGLRLDDRGEKPRPEVGQDDACDLPEAPTRIDLQVRGEVVLPVPAWGDVCRVHGVEDAFGRRDDSDHSRQSGPDDRMSRPVRADLQQLLRQAATGAPCVSELWPIGCRGSPKVDTMLL